MESWNKKKMAEADLDYDFVQDNHSKSIVKGTLRGIHFQKVIRRKPSWYAA